MIRRTPESVDVAIIGAGSGGCSAAMLPAAQGLRVLLIERAAAADVGRKVCGNGMCLEGFREVDRYIAPPSGPEVAARLDGITAYPRSGRDGLRTAGGGVILNRHVFGQRLLADALDAGAELLDECACVGWSDRGANTVRLRLGDGRECDVNARVVIDASGYRAVLTSEGGPTHPDDISRRETAVAYRAILSLREPMDEAWGGFLVFSPEGAESGYAWVFPMGGRLANVGVGARLDGLRGSAKVPFEAFVASREELAGAEVLSASAGILPVRRPRASLVGDGFMAVGDAGCQTSPLHGGGIMPSIIAGIMAGEEAAAAIGRGDTSAQSLWPYGMRFMRGIGALHATHEVLRSLLYSLTPADVDFAARQLSALGAAVPSVRDGALLPSVPESLRRLGAFARRPRLAASVLRAGTRMAARRRHYLDYPDSPDKLGSWMGRTDYLVRSIRY